MAEAVVRRIYDEVEGSGYRVLVDRLWPRGISKERAHLDEWCKEIAPSTELRTWYHHDPDLWPEFEVRYRAELEDPARMSALTALREHLEHGPVVLLTASKRSDISEATVLAEVLNSRSESSS